MKLAAIWTLVFAAAAHAELTETPNIIRATAKADVVLIARLDSLQASASDSGTLAFTPSEVIKGTLQHGGQIHVKFTGLPIDVPIAHFLKPVLVFVADPKPGNVYDLVPLQESAYRKLAWQFLPVVSAPAPEALRASPADTPLQTVVKRLATSYVVSPADGFDTWGALYTLTGDDAESEFELMRAVFRSILNSATPRSFERGAQGFISMGKLESLQILNQASPAERAPLLRNLGFDYKDPAPQGVPILAAWIRSDQPAEQRHAAAMALARIHTTDALLVLGPLLDDPDLEIRALAAHAMFRQAYNAKIRIPVYDYRDINVALWKIWWLQNEAALRRQAAN